MPLRVLAIAPPQFEDGLLGEAALSSPDPASLFNACRVGAASAARSEGAWGQSNWARSRADRRGSVLFLHSLRRGLGQLLHAANRIQPNLVLIGAMSICMPGAVEVARIIKGMLGDDVCIVLGGRHASETMWTERDGSIAHHPGSPLRLMADGRMPRVFDVVVAGDGEHVVHQLGELVDRVTSAHAPAAHVARSLDAIALARGRWIAGALVDGVPRTLSSGGGALDRASLPAPCELFGVQARFDVFGGQPTAHVFSDSGRGCIYDCNFCSERASVTGLPEALETSADRLVGQLRAAARVIRADHPGATPAAFCEDSTLLGYSPRLVRRFCERLAEEPAGVRFGAQLTIDQIGARPDLLAGLRAVGLEYLFLGLETMAPADVGGLSKDVGHRRGSWIERTERAFDTLAGHGITAGVALLFGMGESHASRLALIEQLALWRQRYGFPAPISMNWAVQHPLCGQDGGTGYDYLAWSVPRGPFLDPFLDFGEASVVYPLSGQSPPRIEDVLEVHRAVTALRDTPETALALRISG